MTKMIANTRVLKVIRSIMAVLSVTIALGLLAALMLSVASAAPSAPAQRFTFTKKASNSTPYVGDILTFTLNISPTAQLTQTTWIRVTDPNPAPAYLNILTGTIKGGTEVYSPTFNGVIREFTLTVGTLPQQISFQVEVTGIPTTALTSGYPVTNTATIADASEVGSLPAAMEEAGVRIMPRRVMLPLTLRRWVAWHQYDTYEPNNTREEAYGPLNSGQIYYSHIYNESDQRDYYYLSPTSSGPIVVSLTVPACCDYDLYLYNSLTGNFVAASNYTGKGLNEQMTYNSAQAGTTYYILVYSPYQDHSDQDQYQLRATFP